MKKLILILMLSTALFGQEFGQWRVSHQKFMDAPIHNAQHLGTGLLPYALQWKFKRLKWWQVDLCAVGLGVLWEAKDSVIPYEKFGYWGGEGWSNMDIRTDIYGVVANRILNYSIKKIWKKIHK